MIVLSRVAFWVYDMVDAQIFQTVSNGRHIRTVCAEQQHVNCSTCTQHLCIFSLFLSSTWIAVIWRQLLLN